MIYTVDVRDFWCSTGSPAMGPGAGVHAPTGPGSVSPCACRTPGSIVVRLDAGEGYAVSSPTGTRFDVTREGTWDLV